MMISDSCENILHEDLISFLRDNEFTGLKLRLLLFWGRHPKARFNIDCIAHVLDITRHHLREIMRELIDKGVINEQYCTSGIAHYSLNHEHSLSQHVQDLAQLDWSSIRSLEGAIAREAVAA
jgi:hypothetical protein